ncbi:MAG TPA: PmoA family protein [Tepidisphaeraceae bacterium]|nr:PmoA family protein [Tepidisphaeraceae bacterium]
MILKHDLGTSIELRNPHRELPLWRYVYGGKPKPFFHPLCTPAGHVLSIFEPHDHFWHRGLWFSIKFINGENFWEENEPGFGTQKTRVPPTVTHGADGQIGVFSTLDWTRPDEKTIVFHEQRLFTYKPIDSGSYLLDFTFILKPQVDVLLDRTPYNGTWGGYSGLTFRGNRNWQESRLLFSDGTTSNRPTPVIADWCDLSGKLDGGFDQFGGIAILDHPENPRHPTPWYGGTGPGHYFNAAILFNEPMKVSADDKLRLQYRVLVHDGMYELPQLKEAYAKYISDTQV